MLLEIWEIRYQRANANFTGESWQRHTIKLIEEQIFKLKHLWR